MAGSEMWMRRTYRGFTDMGKVRVPPMPMKVILTDRGTGTKYLLSFSTTVPTVDGYGHITITTQLPNCGREPCVVYKANEEPYIGSNPLKRLYIRDGYLGVDVEELPLGVTDYDQAPSHAIVGWQRSFREIVDYTGPLTHRLAWTPRSV